jgi:hypothetical protein
MIPTMTRRVNYLNLCLHVAPIAYRTTQRVYNTLALQRFNDIRACRGALLAAHVSSPALCEYHYVSTIAGIFYIFYQ